MNRSRHALLALILVLFAACDKKKESTSTPAQDAKTSPDGTNPVKPARRLTHDAEVLALAFSPDGATLASYGADGFLRIWDVKSGEQRRELEWKGFTRAELAFQRDGTGRKLSAILGDNKAKRIVADVESGATLATVEGEGEPGEFSSDGKWVLVGGSGGPPYPLYAVDSREPKIRLGRSGDDVCEATVSPDGSKVAAANYQTTTGPHALIVWRASDGSVLRKWTFDGSTGKIVFTPDGSAVIAYGPLGSYRCTIETGEKTELTGSEASELIPFDVYWSVVVSEEGKFEYGSSGGRRVSASALHPKERFFAAGILIKGKGEIRFVKRGDKLSDITPGR